MMYTFLYDMKLVILVTITVTLFTVAKVFKEYCYRVTKE